MRINFTTATPEQQPHGLLVAWSLRVLNLLVIGVTAWALIETVSFLRAYASALMA